MTQADTVPTTDTPQANPAPVTEADGSSPSAVAETMENQPESVETSAENTATEGTAEQKYQELYNQHLRLAADFENYRKRQQQEFKDTQRMAVERTINTLLPFLDNMDRATRVLSENTDPKTLYQSFSITKQQFLEALNQLGVKRMETIGQAFDPNFHEAVAQVPIPNQPDQSIVEEQMAGYLIQDRVLRAAQVVVASNPDGVTDGPVKKDAAAPGTSNPFAQN